VIGALMCRPDLRLPVEDMLATQSPSPCNSDMVTPCDINSCHSTVMVAPATEAVDVSDVTVTLSVPVTDVGNNQTDSSLVSLRFRYVMFEVFAARCEMDLHGLGKHCLFISSGDKIQTQKVSK